MSKHILVIDDEKHIRELFRLALKKSEFSVETVATGEEGLVRARSRLPSIVFLDLKMPGTNIAGILKQLRKFIDSDFIYVLTKFSKENIQEIQNITNSGFDCNLCKKPINSDQIRMVVDSVLK